MKSLPPLFTSFRKQFISKILFFSNLPFLAKHCENVDNISRRWRKHVLNRICCWCYIYLNCSKNIISFLLQPFKVCKKSIVYLMWFLLTCVIVGISIQYNTNWKAFCSTHWLMLTPIYDEKDESTILRKWWVFFRKNLVK